MFEAALERAGLSNPQEALHCGSHYDNCVQAATAAGWQACYIANPPQEPGPQTLTLMGVSGLLPALGLQPLGGPVLTTRRIGQFVDGGAPLA